MANGHRLFGGSRTHFWKCESAAVASRGKPVQAAGAAAERGTRLHGAFEVAITAWSMGVPVDQALPPDLDSHDKADLATALEQAVAILGEGARDSVWPEAFCPIGQGLGFEAGSRFDALAAGSADVVAYGRGERRAFVIDFKSGSKEVSPDTPQLLLYAAGARASVLAGLVIDTWSLAIVQSGREPALRHLTANEFEAEVKGYRDHLVAAVTAPRRFTPGDHCTWCPARGDCRAHADDLLGDWSDRADVDGLADQTLAAWLGKAKSIESFLDAAKEELTRRARVSGAAPAGTKWVRPVTRRRWADPDDVVRLAETHGLLDLLAPRAPVTPTAALEAVPNLAADLGDLIVRPEGAPVLVSASDRRKAIGWDSAALDALLDESVLFSD
jgi:hypothetical protein